MDLDAYVRAHQGTWQRLDELSRRRPRTGVAADELVDLYQEVATHLSVIRSTSPDPGVVTYLSGLLARARTRAVGTRTAGWSGVADFFVRRFPAALYRTRRWWLTAMLGSYAITAVMMWWLLQHPQVEQSMLDPQQVADLVNNDFEGYYSESAASHFAAQVWINNAWVAALCIAFGVLGAPVVFVLWQNLVNLALVGSIMLRHDRGGLFFGLILPHGLLELTAVFVAAGVGLRLFWSWVAPGDLSRAQSLAAEGRSGGGVAMGLVVVLLVSGVIEGFVTPSGLPDLGAHRDRGRGRAGLPGLRLRARTAGQPRRLDRRHRRLPARGPGRHRLLSRSEQAARLQGEVVVGQAHGQVVGVGVEDVDAQRREQACRARRAGRPPAPPPRRRTPRGRRLGSAPAGRARGRGPRPAAPGAARSAGPPAAAAPPGRPRARER